MRFLVDLPQEDVAWLDAAAKARATSRAALIRLAVSHFRAQDETARITKALEAGFGAWAHRTDIDDAVEWQRRERAGSARPWDDDYEDVRAEFPDLFDAEDDRQRQLYLAAVSRSSSDDDAVAA